MKSNRRLRKELKEVDADIQELEANLESLESYKCRLIHDLSSGIDLDSTRVIDVLDNRFLLGKIKLVCECHNFNFSTFTLAEMVSLPTYEYCDVPWFGERSIKELQDWLASKNLVLLR